MIKYFFCVTYGDHWIEAAIKLRKNKIAKPILWLGDGYHLIKAKNEFGDVAQNMETLVHHPYKLRDIDYNNEFISFFDSIYYLRAKDRCLKMMDRLDMLGNFNRLDREAYFHYLVIYFLKYTFNNKPDIFLSTDSPHSHAQYLLFEICSFLKIPTFKFNNFVFSPILFIENIKTGVRFTKNKGSETEKLNSKIIENINEYILNIKEKKESYTIFYVANQKKNKVRFKKFITKFFIDNFKDIRHHLGLLLKNKTSNINPYKLSFFSRLKIRRIKTKRLTKENHKAIFKMDYEKKYVYYPLHYEPERTSNPDGDDYQDQFKAIVKLRSIVPEEIQIIVKEHPYQLYYYPDKGSRGRSPLFYELIKNVKNLKLIDTNENTIKLILNSLFVATITGTVALEASILGKNALYFGNPWYRDLPNTFSIYEKPTFKLLESQIKNDSKKISDFLFKIFNNHSVLAYMNYSQEYFFKKEFNELIIDNSDDLYSLMEEFFKNQSSISDFDIF